MQRVLLESLKRIQEKLTRDGQVHQVWDTAMKRPKRETEITAWIADRLRDDLHGRGIVINREVEIRVNPSGGVGDRTDIHVNAIAGERVEGAPHVTVIIEVKGCWHAGLLTAMRTQLAQDYLSPTSTHGIYLPVWFGSMGWDDTADRRRQTCSKLDRDDVIAGLRAQAEALRAESYRISVALLDCSLR